MLPSSFTQLSEESVYSQCLDKGLSSSHFVAEIFTSVRLQLALYHVGLSVEHYTTWRLTSQQARGQEDKGEYQQNISKVKQTSKVEQIIFWNLTV